MTSERKESLKKMLATLQSEINTLNKNLEPEKKSKLAKVDTLFKTQKPIPKSPEIPSSDVEAKKNELHHHWNKLLDTLNKEEISGLLHAASSRLEEDTQTYFEKGLSGHAAQYNPGSVDESKRVLNIAQVYFDHVSNEIEKQAEAKFPKTLYHLFDCAEEIVKGNFGDKIRNKFLNSQMISSWKTTLPLLLINLSKYKQGGTSKDDLPEIFAKFQKSHSWNDLLNSLQLVKNEEIESFLGSEHHLAVLDLLKQIDTDPQTLKALMQIFDKFVSNLVNPSSILIQLLLSMKLTEKAILAVSLIKNEVDRSKAIEDIIDVLINENKFDGALPIVDSNHHKT